MIAGAVTALVVAACGGGQNQAAQEPHGKFPVAISSAAFPSAQTLSQHTHLVLAVRNSGHKTIPDVAVTICNVTCAYPAPAGEGTSAAAFAANIGGSDLANPSRPTWIVDRGPGPCGYSCENGGQGGGVTAYANTWALGRLKPGQTVRFNWAVTAVQPGHHVVAWQVAAGLNGNAKAVLSNGSQPRGTFAVDIGNTPPQQYVNNNGQVVSQP